MSNKFIYLDHAATTPIDVRVANKMMECLQSDIAFANSGSQHGLGQIAKNLIETARELVAQLIGAEPQEIIWTSGATEANNLAIKGVAELYQRKGKHIITLKTEHKSVLAPCQYCEKNGFQVTYLTPKKHGLVDLAELEAEIRPDTILVSIMHVNNETGVIQDLPAIAKITSERGILLHTDAAQSVGKINLDVRSLPVDLISLTAHKFYGPKGIGALYLRKKPRVRVQALIHGGDQERGMRSGTLPTHQIVGMGEAYRLAYLESAGNYQNILSLRNKLLSGLTQIKNFRLNVSETAPTVANIISVRFQGMLADAILRDLPNLAVSKGSACQAQSGDTSYVLKAMGLSEEDIKSSLRISLAKTTSREDIQNALKLFEGYF